MPAAPPVSFFVPRFPNPSETFIQAQAEGLLERGARVEITALAAGDPAVLGALRLKWDDNFRVRFAPVPKTLGARIALAPAAILSAHGLAALDIARFGDDAASLRLLIAAARWPDKAPPERRVWLAHYGRWGRFACALRELGLIAGPIATVFHGKDMSAYLKKRSRSAYGRLFKRGDLFLPISAFWREKLLSLGAPPERTLVHRMGVDTTRFMESLRALQPREPVRFIGVGRMVEKKGFDDALAAFAAMRAEAGAPAATLTLIGDGPLRKSLEAQAAQLGLGEAVRFAGLLPHARVAEELGRAHVFVLASRTARSGDMEGIPVALMEAMAQGLPVLATRHSGTPELVEHDVSGLLCDEGDRVALAANMSAVARAPERWAAMGAAGAAKVRAEFDLKVWNDRLLARLRDLYAAPVTSAPERANRQA
jgi:colanic acid/amylovoran biosynthesis glycosyltransferase